MLIDSKTVKVGSVINYLGRSHKVVEIKVSFYGEIEVDFVIKTEGNDATYEISANRLNRALETGCATIQ